VKKLKKYLIPALKKPGPICAMILDPHIQTTHFEKKWQFLLEKLKVHMTPDACSKTVVPISSASQQNIKSKIEQSIFAQRVATRTLTSEIQQYLTEATEDQSVDILKYWLSWEKNFHSVAKMARFCLAIPATSAASKQVFLKSKAIIGPQRASLDSTSIEKILFLKEWACVFCNRAPPKSQQSVEIIN
ncbi:uncharacterized protein VP01_11243g1, partial [Puccinia sorghi]